MAKMVSLLTWDYKVHLGIGFAIRIIFLCYGLYHDQHYDVNYTDVDYSVFTDAARHLAAGRSPYERHTYRYTPLVSLVMLPNLFVHSACGKILFCLVDLVVAILLRALVRHIFTAYKMAAASNSRRYDDSALPKNDKVLIEDNVMIAEREKHSKTAMMIWLYCPLTVAIATRGNCDSIAAVMVLATIYYLQCRQAPFLAGLIHGLAIHFRLYPIAYSLTYFMSIGNFADYNIYGSRGTVMISHSSNSRQPRLKRTIFKREYLLYLLPNPDQLKLVTGCLLSLVTLTGVCYYFYGYQFLYETYFYHLVRKDTRHNFSLYFYLQYLTAGIKNIGVWQGVLVLLPQLILLIVFSFRYGLNRFTVPFCLVAQTFTMITYNTVLTSQYFIWILAVLPLCMWQLTGISKKTAFIMATAWFVAQVAWLLPAYYLEFQGKNTFWYIWMQSVSFFCVNIWILGRLISGFMLDKSKSD